jgi:hypothetical protein
LRRVFFKVGTEFANLSYETPSPTTKKKISRVMMSERVRTSTLMIEEQSQIHNKILQATRSKSSATDQRGIPRNRELSSSKNHKQS